jgi:hypothetical protein
MMRAPFVFVALLALPIGCAKNADTGDDDDDAPVDCSTQVADTFVVGLDHKGSAGMLDFQMMSADPAPPARGNNTWVIQVMSMNAGVDATPLDGASITVTPYMPAHGHGTPVVADVTDMGSGQYELSPVNLWMPGVWQTTIAVTTPTPDSAVFSFCLPD